MADRHTKEQRRKNMSAVKGKDTKPEMLFRKLIHKAGFRYSLHNSALPGKPDLVLKKYKCAVFIHGCFWHQHGCPKSKLPQTNEEFWNEKLSKNEERDTRVVDELLDSGWRVLILWECAFQKKKRSLGDILSEFEFFIHSEEPYLEIPG